MVIPQATAGHRRSAKLHEICQVACSSLILVFGSNETRQKLSKHSASVDHGDLLLSLHVQPEYALLKKVLHLLFTMKVRNDDEIVKIQDLLVTDDIYGSASEV